MAIANRRFLALRLFFATMLALAATCQAETGGVKQPAPRADEWKILLCSGVRAEPGVSVQDFYWVAIPDDRGRCEGDDLLYVEVEDVTQAELADLVALAEDVIARGPRSAQAWSKVPPEFEAAYRRGIREMTALKLCGVSIQSRYEQTRLAGLGFCADDRRAVPGKEESFSYDDVALIFEISNDPRPTLLWLQVAQSHDDKFQ